MLTIEVSLNSGDRSVTAVTPLNSALQRVDSRQYLHLFTSVPSRHQTLCRQADLHWQTALAAPQSEIQFPRR